MTFSIVGDARVKRTVKPKPEPWACNCPATEPVWDVSGETIGVMSIGAHVVQRAYVTRCTDCGAKRP